MYTFPKIVFVLPTLPIPTLPPPLIEVFSGNPCLKLLHTLDAASSEAPGYPPTIEIFGVLMIQCHEMYTTQFVRLLQIIFRLFMFKIISKKLKALQSWKKNIGSKNACSYLYKYSKTSMTQPSTIQWKEDSTLWPKSR